MKRIVSLIIICGLANWAFSQNFGIDTPNPAEKLDVNGDIALRGIKLAAFFKNPISGGGNLTWESNVLSWTQRIIVLPAGDAGGEHLNTAPWSPGPQSVTIGTWNVAYMRPSDANLSANGGSYNEIQVASYPSYDPELGDVIVAVHNGDNGMLYTGWGVVIPPNSTYTSDGQLIRTLPAFCADLNATLSSSATNTFVEISNWRVSGLSNLFDSNNNFNESSGRFTAPRNGYYHFSGQVRFDGINSGYARLCLFVNGTQDYNNGMHAIMNSNANQGLYNTLSISGTVKLAAGDYVSLWGYSNNDASWNMQHESGFNGYLVSEY